MLKGLAKPDSERDPLLTSSRLLVAGRRMRTMVKAWVVTFVVWGVVWSWRAVWIGAMGMAAARGDSTMSREKVVRSAVFIGYLF